MSVAIQTLYPVQSNGSRCSSEVHDWDYEDALEMDSRCSCSMISFPPASTLDGVGGDVNVDDTSSTR